MENYSLLRITYPFITIEEIFMIDVVALPPPPELHRANGQKYFAEMYLAT